MRYFLIPSLANVHADNGGQAILSHGWIHPRRLLTSSVVLLGIKGVVRFKIDGEAEELRPGRLVVLPAGYIHEGTATLDEAAQYYWMHFTLGEPGSLLSQAEADTILSSEGVTGHLLENAAFLPLSFDLSESGPFLESFHGILNQQENPSYTGWKFQLLFQSLLIQLTEAVIKSHTPPTEVSHSSRVVYEILARVAEDLTNPDLSIKGIANGLALNVDYAGRRFKQVMGMSVGGYIAKERIKRAVLQLQQTTDTMQTIAHSCGFATLRHFLRQFKTHHGVTPNEYRNRYRMRHINSL